LSITFNDFDIQEVAKSSANKVELVFVFLYIVSSKIISLINILNKIGQRTPPCGTPTSILKSFENDELTFILNDLFFRNSEIQIIINLSNYFFINLNCKPLCHILTNGLRSALSSVVGTRGHKIG
jgi:hypothetical protein